MHQQNVEYSGILKDHKGKDLHNSRGTQQKEQKLSSNTCEIVFKYNVKLKNWVSENKNCIFKKWWLQLFQNTTLPMKNVVLENSDHFDIYIL